MTTFKIYYGATKPIIARGANQCHLLMFAEKYPGWHSFSKDRATRQAVKALSAKDCLEVIGDQFRFCYPKGKTSHA